MQTIVDQLKENTNNGRVFTVASNTRVIGKYVSNGTLYSDLL